MENKLIEINIIYKKTIESVIQRIDEDFAELLSKIDNIIQKGNINETTVSELKSDLKNFNNLYDKKINLLNEFVKNKYNYLESTIYNIFIESIEEYSKDASFLDTIKRSPLLMWVSILGVTLIGIPLGTIAIIISGIFLILGGLVEKNNRFF